MTLEKLYQDGTIKFLHARGIIGEKASSYFDYYKTFEKHRKNNTYRQAVVFASVEHDVSIETIKRAIRLIRG